MEELQWRRERHGDNKSFLQKIRFQIQIKFCTSKTITDLSRIHTFIRLKRTYFLNLASKSVSTSVTVAPQIVLSIVYLFYSKEHLGRVASDII